MTRPNLAERTTEAWQPPAFRAESSGVLTAFVDRARRFLDLPASSIWRDLTEELAGATGRVVDVGCGAQPYRRLLPKGTSYQGLDDESAARHFGYQVPDTIYFSGATWPVEAQSADLVLATETLEHVADVPVFLAEAHRVLRPGASLLLTVPFAARWHYIPFDYWRFTPSGLKLVLEKAGFVEVVVHGRGNALTVACYKTIALVVPLLMPQGRGIFAATALRILGLLTSPVMVGCAIVGNWSLASDAGDDCLGYTVRCRRPQSRTGTGGS